MSFVWTEYLTDGGYGTLTIFDSLIYADRRFFSEITLYGPLIVIILPSWFFWLFSLPFFGSTCLKESCTLWLKGWTLLSWPSLGLSSYCLLLRAVLEEMRLACFEDALLLKSLSSTWLRLHVSYLFFCDWSYFRKSLKMESNFYYFVKNLVSLEYQSIIFSLSKCGSCVKWFCKLSLER